MSGNVYLEKQSVKQEPCEIIIPTIKNESLDHLMSAGDLLQEPGGTMHNTYMGKEEVEEITIEEHPIVSAVEGATDDEDSDNKSATESYKEHRREARIQAEQKRRDAIKKGYDTLQELVPTCQQADSSGHNLSMATVLQQSVDYIQFLLSQLKKLEEEHYVLHKELVALSIMQAKYERLVETQLDDTKFQVFEAVMDQLFQSFSSIPMNNFSELSGSVLSWLEQYGKPQILHGLVVCVLHQLNIRLAQNNFR